MKQMIGSLAALVLAFATPASAAPSFELGSSECSNADLTPTASACVGWYQGNLNGGRKDMKTASADALNALLGTGVYSAKTLEWIEGINVGGNLIDFSTPLYGDTVVSFHVGAANGEVGGVGYQASAFYRFDAGSQPGGLGVLTLNRPGLSNARLYYTGSVPPVPEPATWAMMILGFGMAGLILRRRRGIGKALIAS